MRTGFAWRGQPRCPWRLRPLPRFDDGQHHDNRQQAPQRQENSSHERIIGPGCLMSSCAHYHHSRALGQGVRARLAASLPRRLTLSGEGILQPPADPYRRVQAGHGEDAQHLR